MVSNPVSDERKFESHRSRKQQHSKRRSYFSCGSIPTFRNKKGTSFESLAKTCDKSQLLLKNAESKIEQQSLVLQAQEYDLLKSHQIIKKLESENKKLRQSLDTARESQTTSRLKREHTELQKEYESLFAALKKEQQHRHLVQKENLTLQEGFRLCEQAIEQLKGELREAKDECVRLRIQKEASIKSYRGFVET